MFGFFSFYLSTSKFSWSLLCRLHDDSSVSNLPGLIRGDFNEILFNFEKNGDNSRAFSLMQDFRDTITALNLQDLLAKGPKFTWMKKCRGRK